MTNLSLHHSPLPAETYLSENKRIHVSVLPCIPWAKHLRSNLSLGTVSKAIAKSKWIASTTPPASKIAVRDSTTSRSCDARAPWPIPMLRLTEQIAPTTPPASKIVVHDSTTSRSCDARAPWPIPMLRLTEQICHLAYMIVPSTKNVDLADSELELGARNHSKQTTPSLRGLCHTDLYVFAGYSFSVYCWT